MTLSPAMEALRKDACADALSRDHRYATPWHLAAVIVRLTKKDSQPVLAHRVADIELTLSRMPIGLPGPKATPTEDLINVLSTCDATGQSELLQVGAVFEASVVDTFRTGGEILSDGLAKRAQPRERSDSGHTLGHVEPIQLETDPESLAARYDIFDHEKAAERINRSVVGQGEAIRRVVNRLKMTTQQMDSRPERPDGVFLFAGPTGTGKTALALEVSNELFGTRSVIRYDMSEFSQEHTVARMLGAPPGYRGSDDPQGWLTTRINRDPRTLLLLDEIEKAHPSVWTTFLQVFDAGQLTDSMGNAANFRHVVICMTTNVGADSFYGENASLPPDQQADLVLEAMKERMPIELLNRIDDFIVFHPLDFETVKAIARNHLDKTLSDLARFARNISFDDAVFDQVVEQGFSREFGARQLLRAIDTNIREPAACVRPGDYAAVVVEGQIKLVVR